MPNGTSVSQNIEQERDTVEAVAEQLRTQAESMRDSCRVLAELDSRESTQLSNQCQLLVSQLEDDLERLFRESTLFQGVRR